jgi:hypothetical protein
MMNDSMDLKHIAKLKVDELKKEITKRRGSFGSKDKKGDLIKLLTELVENSIESEKTESRMDSGVNECQNEIEIITSVHKEADIYLKEEDQISLNEANNIDACEIHQKPVNMENADGKVSPCTNEISSTSLTIERGCLFQFSEELQQKTSESQNGEESNEHDTEVSITAGNDVLRRGEGIDDIGDFENNTLSKSVRIDNFQRPLQIRALAAWLSEKCDVEIPIESIWLNPIKTHCYVDFDSVDSARKCVLNVTGCKYPSSSNLVLQASFTKINAAMAPNAAEAAMKPGEWQSRAGHESLTIENDSKTEKTPSAQISSASFKNDETSSESLSRSPRVFSGRLGQPNPFDVMRKAAALAASSVKNAPLGIEAGNRSSNESYLKRRVNEVSSDDNVQRHVKTKQIAVENFPESEEGLSLDELFSRTVTKPVLYWLPVTAEEVSKRENDRDDYIMKAKARQMNVERASDSNFRNNVDNFSDRGVGRFNRDNVDFDSRRGKFGRFSEKSRENNFGRGSLAADKDSRDFRR